MITAAITAAAWSITGHPDASVVRAITVLVIACPHALGSAIPLVVSIATERAARGGVLIKGRLALEGMRTVDAVLFDKTGTLTKSEPTVTAVHAGSDLDDDTVLALAAAAEADSEHPLASQGRGLSAPEVVGRFRLRCPTRTSTPPPSTSWPPATASPKANPSA